MSASTRKATLPANASDGRDNGKFSLIVAFLDGATVVSGTLG